MGFWDREVKDSFDAMFDLDGNGRLDDVEEIMQIEYLEEEMKADSDDDDDDDDEWFDSDSDLDEGDDD